MSYDLVIRGGKVVDGSGAAGFVADVRVQDGKIAEIVKIKDSAPPLRVCFQNP